MLRQQIEALEDQLEVAGSAALVSERRAMDRGEAISGDEFVRELGAGDLLDD
jgi:Spy/CpxP family protein refolding chaperone